MVDRILEFESGKRMVGIKNVTMSEDFLTHHFPGFPVMPGVLVIEAMTQLAGWLLAVSTDFKYKALLSGVRQARFSHFIRPGDSLWLEVILVSRLEDIVSFKGVGKLGPKAVAKVSFEAKLVALERLENPEETKALFSLLSSSDEEIKRDFERERKSLTGRLV